MIAKRKTPDGLADYSQLRVKNSRGDMINDVLSLSTGLDLAISSIKKGEISEKARAALLDLVAQSYQLFAYRIAHGLLKDEGLITKEAVSDLLYRFDLPDDNHDDLVIYYKKR
ncbi:hypothetical protein CQ476_30 [TM7 phage DolZOral124_53_65]|nr:hypothetical protein CQ476_30 [TM7 phage DolZOral124_53_65]